MLLPGMDAEQAVALAERVRRDVQLRPIVSSEDVRATVSQGVAVARGLAVNAHTLMQEADLQLYRAKATRDTVCVGAQRAMTVPGPRHDLDSFSTEGVPR
jgi:diguanylate cyclase (GGDEF)-like protein